MAKRILIIITFIALAMGYVAFEAYKLDNKLEAYSVNQSVIAPAALPDVNLDAFKSKNSNLSLRNLASKNNYLFIHFWATWCGPCEKELPELLDMAKSLEAKDNFKILLISVNDDEKKISKFLSKLVIPKNVELLVDNNSVFQKNFGTYKLPETYIYTPQGNFMKKFVGPQAWMQSYLLETFRSL